jgi:tripartite ATP-independent transporter DctM subunit
MEPITIGILGFILFCGLIVIRVPISYGLAGVGTMGLFYIYGPQKAIAFIPQQIYTHASNFTFAAIPLFLLMGYLAFYADLSKDAYDAARAWFGKIPGGLAVATIYACAIFGACSGSSLAECAVFSKIAIPEMVASKYNKKLALGVVAAAGGLDVLIPPSILMVVYGVMTETSVGKLLVAGILPGILYAVIFAVAVTLFCYFKPSYGPKASHADTSWKAKMIAIKKIWGVVLLFGLVLGAIYTGWATPDEAAAVGVFGSFLLVLFRKKFNWRNFNEAVIDSTKATAMIFLLLGGACVFTAFMSVTGVVSAIAKWIIGMNLPLWGLLGFLYILYLIMGCFLDAVSMMLLTMPFVVPILQAKGLSLIWFGVIICMLCVIGAITPPLGLNVYVMKGALGKEVKLEEIFAGALPFVFLMVLITIILSIFPQISLFLPDLMMGK